MNMGNLCYMMNIKSCNQAFTRKEALEASEKDIKSCLGNKIICPMKATSSS